jgi:DNA polymerase III alpha subunit (gram-positive type)
MKYYYDLHIHSVLSPCADVLMTPQNIFNMAMLKELDIISITDHNSLKQIPLCMEIAKSYDMLFIPGVEVTVKEGIDILLYFKHFKDAMDFDCYLEKFLEKKKVDLTIYNEQCICDINDECIDTYPYLLAQTTKLSIKELITYLAHIDHVMIYAHVDRYIEKVKPLIEKYELNGISYYKKKIFTKKNLLHHSDAHQITDILERNKENEITLDTCTLDCFFRYFNHG